MSKYQENLIIINKILSNLPPNHIINNVNIFKGHCSVFHPIKLVKSREKHSELIIAAHSIEKINKVKRYFNIAIFFI